MYLEDLVPQNGGSATQKQYAALLILRFVYFIFTVVTAECFELLCCRFPNAFEAVILCHSSTTTCM